MALVVVHSKHQYKHNATAVVTFQTHNGYVIVPLQALVLTLKHGIALFLHSGYVYNH